MIYLILFLWCIAAMLTAKADAMLAKWPTYAWMFALALFTWPIVALFIILTPHDCDGPYEL